MLNFRERTCLKEIWFDLEEMVINEGRDDLEGSNTMFEFER